MTLFEKAIQTQLLVTPKSCEVFKDVSDLLPNLRRYMSNDVGDSGRAEIIKILRTFTSMCHLNDEDEPHPQNQKILYNFGELRSLNCGCGLACRVAFRWGREGEFDPPLKSCCPP